MKTKYFSAFFLMLITVFLSGCNKDPGRQNQSTITVFGTGTVAVQPDVVQMSITLSKIEQTTKMAQEEVSKMVKQAMDILKEANIEDKNINTASLTFRSEHEYMNNKRVLIGQRAEQRITFSIEEVVDDTEKVSAIIDKLIQINGIELDQIQYRVKNPSDYYVKSRDLAFKKAVEKATQYAELSKLRIRKVLTITDEGTRQASPINNRLMAQNAYFEADVSAAKDEATILPIGSLEITTNISVVFLLK
jgi:uncharacterized protein YggE